MRAAALLLLLVLPAAAAQVPEVPLVELSAEEPPLVRPLLGPVLSNLTLRVACVFLDERGSIPVAYAVETAPAWATTVVSPASDTVDAASCQGGYATRTAQLIATASDQAPAFQPTAVAVSATVGPAARQERATATLNLTADYFSILDSQLAETSKHAPPESEVSFTVKISSLGNAATRVTFEVVEASPDLTVLPVEPLVLESRQQGGTNTTDDAVVKVRTSGGGIYVNRVGTVTLRVLSEHAGEPPRIGDTTTLSFVVTTRSGAQPEDRQEAALPLVATLAALALAAAGGARRGRTKP